MPVSASIANALTIGTTRPARSVPNVVEQKPTSHGSTALPTLAIENAGPTARGRTGARVRERSANVIGNTGAKLNPATAAAANATGTDVVTASTVLAPSATVNAES